MRRVTVNTDSLRATYRDLERLRRGLDDARQEVRLQSMSVRLLMRGRAGAPVSQRLGQMDADLRRLNSRIERLKIAVDRSADLFERTERSIKGLVEPRWYDHFSVRRLPMLDILTIAVGPIAPWAFSERTGLASLFDKYFVPHTGHRRRGIAGDAIRYLPDWGKHPPTPPSPWEKFWDFWKGREGAYAATSAGFEYGIIGAEASASFLSWEAKGKVFGEGKSKDDSIGLGVEYGAKGQLAKAELETHIGPLRNTTELAAGEVAAKGTAKAVLIEDGEFNPQAELGVKGEATAVRLTQETQFGTDDFNIHQETEAKLLTAEAEAKLVLSKDEVGFKTGATAALAKGTAKGGFTLFGVRLDGEVTGSVGSVGATTEASVTPKSIEFGGGLAAALGLEFKIKISW